MIPPSQDLVGHSALVTGSSSGVGAAIATRLAASGCRVLVHGRDRVAADRVVAGIGSVGGAASAVLADLDVAEDVQTLAAAAREHEVDVLVANAGPFVEHDWDHVDAAAWAAAYHGNVVSTAVLINAVLPSLRARGWGRVITVGSRAVLTPLPNMVEYSAAKAAVANMTVSLAAHLADSGVTANCVSPGVILTPSLRQMFLDRRPGSTWEDIEAEVTGDYAPNPCGRLGRPEDVANAVAFLAGPGADYVNAAHLRVDGGITGAL